MRVMHGKKWEKGRGASPMNFTAFQTCLISYLGGGDSSCRDIRVI